MLRFILLLGITALGVSTARADLYTGRAYSIDWLVDSSDEIVAIRSAKHAERGLEVTLLETLKKRLTLEQFREVTRNEGRQLYRIGSSVDEQPSLQFRYADWPGWRKAGWHAAQPADWLLFLRTDGKTWHMIYSINVTRPRELSRNAAITPAGEALINREQILKYVHARVALGHRLPPRCDRELLEERGKRSLVDWNDQTRRESFFLRQDQVDKIVGGFRIPISNDYWDHPDVGDFDEDLLLTSVFVPAEPRYETILLKRLTGDEHPTTATMLAILNYPSEEAEAALDQIVESGRTSGLVASRLLYFLRYQRSPAHPLDSKLIGRWVLHGANEHVDLDLRADHTCQINTRPTKVTENLPGYRPVTGRGYWAIREGKLWIGRSHVRRGGKWTPGRREFFRPKTMLKIEDDEIKLRGGPPMKRVTS